ncbi:glycosyltransferase, partial [Klebsiella pneumoniae]|uniref:glycosyltransferase n=1 Tax=Klebsiella pneumoniae TaxID=573 RepID=UPI0023AF8EF1
MYRRAELFLYPSLAEGFGLPLLDAILFGLPVLASQRTSMAEVGMGATTFFDPAEPDATRWLGERIAAHFAGDPV